MKLKYLSIIIYILSLNLKAQDLYLFQDKELYGYINLEGEITIPAQFAFANEFSDCALALVMEPNKKFGYINKEGKYVLKPNYTFASKFRHKRAFIYDDNIYKIINSLGETIKILPNIHMIKLKKNTLYPEFIVTTKSGKSGVINPLGELLIDTVYNNLIHIYSPLFTEVHYFGYDSVTYQVIDYTTPEALYDFYGFIEDWDTGLTNILLRNKKTLKTDTIYLPSIETKKTPISHRIKDNTNQYYNTSTSHIILETPYSNNSMFKSVSYKTPRNFEMIKSNKQLPTFILKNDSFFYTPTSDITHIKQFKERLLPVQEIYFNNTWIDPLNNFIMHCRDCDFAPSYIPIDSSMTYRFQYPEIYGDLKVKARMKLEVILNNSDTTTIYSKLYKTKIPSYFTPEFPMFYIRNFIEN